MWINSCPSIRYELLLNIVYELKASNDDEIMGDVEVEKLQLATPSSTTTVFALQAAASLDTLEMKHESDEGFLRDLINEHDNSAWYYDNAHLCRIGPSPRIMASMDTKPAELVEKTWRKVEKKTNLATSTQRGKKRGGGSGGKFFSNTDGGGVNSSTKTTTTTVTKTMKKGSSTGRNVEKKTNHTSRNKKIPSAFAQRTTSAMTRPPTAFAASSSSQSQSQSVVAVCSREKLEQAKQKKQKMTVGTVDDFKGDVDEDSEDEYDLEQRRAKSTKIQEQQSRLDAILNEEDSVSGAEDNTSSSNPDEDADEDDIAEARKTPSTSNRNTTTKKKSVKVIDDDDEDNDVIQYDDGPSSGGGTYRPMDAFAVKTNKKKLAHEEDTNSSRVPKKKKRKIFKDTTTMNKQGFMVTTTEEVWEDIEEEEEDPQQKQSSSSTATTNTKATKSTIHSTKFGKINIKKKQASTGMKQGTMASFFSVKKKK